MKVACTVLRGGDDGNIIPLTRPLRKGQKYGTVLVDLEQRHLVDLLPDREKATVTAWLKAHPGVKLISRDRGGSYAEVRIVADIRRFGR